MANAKKCDRCGRLYECYEGVPMIPLGNKYNSILLTSSRSACCKSYDLCPPCMVGLRVWLGYEPGENEQDMEAGTYEPNDPEH